MRRAVGIVSIMAMAALGAGASVPAATASPVVQPGLQVVLRTATGATAGTATLAEHSGQTHVLVRATGLTPGFHGFHVHSVGRCDGTGTTPFASAGGHLNPDGAAHGAHDGDLPPLYADAGGDVVADFVTDSFALRDLLDGDGSALVVHAGPDNLGHVPSRYTYQNPDGTTGTGPDATTSATGDAGGRYACGVVSPGDTGHGMVRSTRDRTARAVLLTPTGASAGVVRFGAVAGSDRVHVSVDASGLSAGFHGFHVHAVGRCDGSTTPPFTSAGGHLGSGADAHGHHAGDLPPLLATADGRARAEFDTDAFRLADVLDADGGAVVVHAAPDNLGHIPARYSHANPDGTSGTGPDATTRGTGDAGARALCGTVVAPPPPATASVRPDVPVITAGNGPVLTVTVTDTTGAPAPDVPVELFAKRYGEAAYVPLLGGHTDDGGVLRVPVRPFTQTAYVARVAGVPDARTLIGVHARVVLGATGSSSAGTLTLSGRLMPEYAGAAVGVAAMTSSGRRVYVGETRTRADGTFAATVRRQAGSATYVVYTPARHGTRYGSATVRV